MVCKPSGVSSAGCRKQLMPSFVGRITPLFQLSAEQIRLNTLPKRYFYLMGGYRSSRIVNNEELLAVSMEGT